MFAHEYELFNDFSLKIRKRLLFVNLTPIIFITMAVLS